MKTELEGFFCSTLHQSLTRLSSTKDDGFTKWKRKDSPINTGWTWTVKELKSIFVNTVIRSAVNITMFVDALDECESPTDARKPMDLLTNTHHHQYAEQPRLKTCVPCQHYPNVGVSEPLQVTVENANRDDITRYVMMTLRRLHVDLSDDLTTQITSRSNGMFLWAFLLIGKIQEALDDGEPREVLKVIIDRAPPHLEQDFKGLINSIPVNERERSSRILLWTLLARRPLSISKLFHALAFRTGSGHQRYSGYETSDSFIGPA
jgi:hypothetical protein